jgi:hypothetical protein
MKYPKMRPVNVFPVIQSGKRMICLKDASGLAENTIFIPQEAFLIVSMLNGQNSVRDIQAAYMSRFGNLLYTERIQKVIDYLDTNLFLEGERFEAHKQKLMVAFKQAATRPFVHQNDTPQNQPAPMSKASLPPTTAIQTGQGRCFRKFPLKASKVSCSPILITGGEARVMHGATGSWKPLRTWIPL